MWTWEVYKEDIYEYPCFPLFSDNNMCTHMADLSRHLTCRNEGYGSLRAQIESFPMSGPVPGALAIRDSSRLALPGPRDRDDWLQHCRQPTLSWPVNCCRPLLLRDLPSFCLLLLRFCLGLRFHETVHSNGHQNLFIGFQLMSLILICSCWHVTQHQRLPWVMGKRLSSISC